VSWLIQVAFYSLHVHLNLPQCQWALFRFVKDNSHKLPAQQQALKKERNKERKEAVFPVN
jgi:hypothetical protein